MPDESMLDVPDEMPDDMTDGMPDLAADGGDTARGAGRGVILEGTGGIWKVRTAAGETREASIRGRLKKVDGGKRSDGSIRRNTVRGAAETIKLAVGDDVLLEEGDTPDGTLAIAEILPRRSRLARRAPGGGHGERVVVANIDQVVVVFAAARPEPHPRMLDRFLVIAEANALHARIVINKVELTGEDAARARFGDYERIGYPVHYTSVKTEAGIHDLHASLVGRTSALSGPSGVGKSSLINTLYPGLDLRVGEISESVNKGRHTTVGALLHPLPNGPAGEPGGFVVDTPGLREIGMWGLEPSDLHDCFPELRGARDQCRFADCTHTVEPACGVRTALHEHRISPERYDSYVRLRTELAETARVW